MSVGQTATTSFAVLSSDHPALAAKLPANGMPVHCFPFTVGRPPDVDEQSPASLCDLVFVDERPYRIARVQFTLIRDFEGIWLIDASSVYGTIVNGASIGPGCEHDRALLEEGRNEVRIGGAASPYLLNIGIVPLEQSDLAA